MRTPRIQMSCFFRCWLSAAVSPDELESNSQFQSMVWYHFLSTVCAYWLSQKIRERSSI